MKNILYIAIIFGMMISCKKEVRKITDNSKEPTELKKDTSAIEIGDLPILIDSTEYLIHPIGAYQIGRSWKSSYSSDSYERTENVSFSISNYNGNYMSGNISNLSFQHIDSTELRPLTDKIINISSIRFLNNSKSDLNKDLIIYEVLDQDTNQDQKLDYNDVKALYLSPIDGSSFVKMTPDLQELVNWKLLEINHTLYFRSIEDTNSNGEFDKKDKMHYFYVNLNQPNLKAVEYFPIN